MIGFTVKVIFLSFWLCAIGFSVYFFNRTVKTVTTLQELWGFIVLYSFVVISATIVSFSVLFSSKEK
ncbi:MAG: hypothetical protein ACP5SD_06045 [Elusimicrobiales bacterium]|nr:hypothetical protein [Elusimicrobiales bacterium]HOL63195.1 hypothetical protein [Elusimicrobiales bacterium]HPO94824.1 hypothetical protein [Elusimicrobiales bacterium]